MLSFFKKRNEKKDLRPSLDFSFEILEKEIECQIKGWLGLKEQYLEVFAKVLFSLGVPIKQVKFMKYNKNENSFTVLAHDAWTIYLRYGNWDFSDELWVQKDSVTKKYDFIFRKDEFQLIYRGLAEECCGFITNSCFLSHYAAFSNVTKNDTLSITINLDFNFTFPLSKKQAVLEEYVKSISSSLSVKEILRNILDILDISAEDIERIDKIEIKRTLVDQKQKKEDFTTHELFYSKGIITQIIDTDNIATTNFALDESWSYTEIGLFSINYANSVYVYNGTIAKDANINMLIVKAESSAMHTQLLLSDIQSYVNRK